MKTNIQEPTQKKSFLPQRLQIHGKNFAQETTTHGVAQLAKDGSKLRVFVYAVALLASSALLLYILTMSIIRYRSGDSYIDVTIERKDNLTFPSVTICPLSFMSQGMFEREFPEIDIEFFQETQQFGPFGLNYDVETDEEFHNVSRIQESLRRYLASTYNTLYFNSWLSNDIFLRCVFDSRVIDCSDYISTLLTDLGYCHTFHSRDVAKRHGPFVDAYANRLFGIILTLDANPDDYLYTSFMSSGFAVLINDLDVFPVTDGKSIFVGPGQSTDIALEKEIHTKLPPPFSNEDCVDDVDSEEDYFKGFPYSSKSCYFLCTMNNYFERCGCFFQSENSSEDCTGNDLLQCGLGEGTFDVLRECASRCKRTCTSTKYITTISTSAYPNPVAVEVARRLNFPAQNESAIRRRLLELSLHFATLDETRVTQHPRYEPFEIFSNFGGMLGLCLGVSLISLLELCEFLLRLLLICCKRQNV